MYLARITHGSKPIVTPVDEHEHYLDATGVVRRRRRSAWSRKTKTGAAALSQSPEGAAASAIIMLNANVHERRIREQSDRQGCRDVAE